MKPKPPSDLWASFENQLNMLANTKRDLVPIRALAAEVGRDASSFHKFVKRHGVPTRLVPLPTEGGIQTVLCIDAKVADKIRRYYRLVESYGQESKVSRVWD